LINLFHSILLLQRSDVDTALKDSEGYRAFDLYNTTVEDTMPNKRDVAGCSFELYTWGVNRHVCCLAFWVPNQWCSVITGTPPWATAILMTVYTLNRLSLGVIVRQSVAKRLAIQSLSNCSLHGLETPKCQGCIQVRPNSLRKAHAPPLYLTVVITDESHANVRACGFASTGRRVTFNFNSLYTPLPDFGHRTDLALVEVNIPSPRYCLSSHWLLRTGLPQSLSAKIIPLPLPRTAAFSLGATIDTLN